MRSAICLLLSFLVLVIVARPGLGATPKAAASVVKAGNQFAVDLYGQLDKEQPQKNLFFSPVSISMALAMTAAGARGKTETEMAKTLCLEGNLSEAHADYQRLLAQWNAEGAKRDYQLRVANRLWGQSGYPFLPEYLALTRQQYGAELGLLDFKTQAEAARAEINTWVEKQTEQKIKDLMPRGAVNNMTRLVLTNAIYFKGDWVKQFDKKRTKDEDFTVSANQKVKTPLMYLKTRFGYADDATLQALVMPYKGNELSMFVLLPRKADGLAALEKSLSAEKLASLRSEVSQREVIVYMPKFKLETSFQLNQSLEALGMKLAFAAGAADFSGMDGRKDLYISAAIHKAFVDVNEEGTEAAAATGIAMRAMSAMPSEPPPVFRADHPFVFMICDNRDGSILFLGRVINPK
jgi:serpin B